MKNKLYKDLILDSIAMLSYSDPNFFLTASLLSCELYFSRKVKMKIGKHSVPINRKIDNNEEKYADALYH